MFATLLALSLTSGQLDPSSIDLTLHIEFRERLTSNGTGAEASGFAVLRIRPELIFFRPPTSSLPPPEERRRLRACDRLATDGTSLALRERLEALGCAP